MSYIAYLSDLTYDTFDQNTKPHILSDDIKQAIIGENHYPLIEHHDGQDLFVVIVPIYDQTNHTLSLVECDILKSDKYCFIITDHHCQTINQIVHTIHRPGSKNEKQLFQLIIELCTHVLNQIATLENKIIELKSHTLDKGQYNEQSINAIMQMKLDIGMFKSSINPLGDIMWHLFDTISSSQDTIQEFRKNQLDHLITQIKSQSQFLYENISIVADTCNAVQNIHANNIMKTLTIISSIFIPLSFIAGIFGMNFNAIPGHSEIFYYSLLIGMIFIGLVQLYVFKKKGRF